MISFNKPPYVGKEKDYIAEAIAANKICGDGQFTKKCHQLLEEMTGSQKVLLTTSGSHALEMAALLCDLEPGDEVILPSFTFSSTDGKCLCTCRCKACFRGYSAGYDEHR